MAPDNFDGFAEAIADMAATGQGLGYFSALALTMILERLHEQEPFPPQKLEQLNLALALVTGFAPHSVAEDARLRLHEMLQRLQSPSRSTG